jgi:hypothetical protein
MAVRRWLTAWLTAAVIALGGPAGAGTPDPASAQAFTQGQLEELVAPIALYPDSLVAQILMASTYPLEVVQAARWVKANPGLKGEELEQALASESWDPSVKALTNFPEVLERMSDSLDLTQDLGDAVLAQEQDVMDAIQRLRRYAQDAGNLQSTAEQKVVVQEKIIVIEPAAEVVYVPAYNPTVVYGTYWRPVTYYYPVYSYPPSYWYPPGYVASNVVSFWVGVAVGAAIWDRWNWGHCDWRGRGVKVNNNFNFKINVNTANINIGNRIGGGRYSKWEHNASHRGGVRYRDADTRARFAGSSQQSRIDRDTARGFDRSGKRADARPAGRDDRAARPTSRDLERSLGKVREDAALGGGARPGQRETRDLSGSLGSAGRAPDRSVGDRAAPRDLSSSGRLSDRSADRPSAFQGQGRDTGSFERAASSRGAQSRGLGGGGGGLGAGGPGRAGGGLAR